MMPKLYHWDVATPCGREFHFHSNPPMTEAEVLLRYPGSKVEACEAAPGVGRVGTTCCLPKG